MKKGMHWLAQGAVGAAALASTIASTAQANFVTDWAAIQVGELHGRPQCTPGSGECNRCTRDVVASFGRLGTAAVSVQGKSVNSQAGVYYAPAAEAIDTFDVFKSHFQGFARVDFDVPITVLGHPDELAAIFGPPLYRPSPRNSAGHWYAHAFGSNRPNGMTLSWKADSFFPSVPDNQRRDSSPNFYFTPPSGSHVGGLHAVGKYLLAAIDLSGSDTHIAVFDLSRPLEMRWAQGQGVKKINIGALGVTRAASVAAAQLFDGSYLVAVQERSVYDAYFPWNSDLSEHSYSVFRVGSLDDPKDVTLVSQPKNIPLAGADNLSALTDCDTGEVYLVAAGANDTDAPNFWSLLKVHSRGLAKVDSSQSPDFNEGSCQARAAGSAFTSEDGRLIAACIGKDEHGGVTHRWDWEEWTVSKIGVVVQQ